MSVNGNEEVLATLDHCRQLAEQHQLRHVAISMVTYPNHAVIASVGEVPLQRNQRESVGKLLELVNKAIETGIPPDPDPDLDASYAMYNLVTGSISFDFTIWLIDAEMRRIREGAPAPLKVGFWWGNEPKEKDHHFAHKTRFLNNVFRPMLGLIGAVEDDRAIGGHRSGVYTPHPLVKAVRAGEKVPRLSVPLSPMEAAIPEHLRFKDAPITITLREGTHWPHRNSDLPAWFRFACDLRAAGERVVFIRDTEKAHEGVAGFETDPFASLDLVRRCARYQGAKANLFVSNGPVGLALFGDRPWLQFVEIEENGYLANTAAFWKDENGLEIGEQYPWSSETQRIVWLTEGAKTTYENICAGWDKIKDQI